MCTLSILTRCELSIYFMFLRRSLTRSAPLPSSYLCRRGHVPRWAAPCASARAKRISRRRSAWRPNFTTAPPPSMNATATGTHIYVYLCVYIYLYIWIYVYIYFAQKRTSRRQSAWRPNLTTVAHGWYIYVYTCICKTICPYIYLSFCIYVYIHICI